MNNNSNNCGDCGTTCSECGRPWAICKQDGGCGCNKCKDIKFCEYGRMANGCIREKQPGCPMQAVIPSVTVESIEGIKNLADCLVHVSDINTTFYIDDKHRPIITWAGPVDIPGYDMEGNPNNYRDQIVTDVANQMAVIYDKTGKGYAFGLVEDLDLQDQIDNKLDEMVEDGTLQEIIGEYLNSTAVFGFDTVADMKSATNLIDGSFACTLGYHAKNDGGAGLYKIRNVTNDDVIDEGSIVEMNDPQNQLVAELIGADLNVHQFGAYGDGVHNDTQAFVNYINFANTINLLPKTYKLTNLNIAKDATINGNGATLIDDTAVDKFIAVDTTSTPKLLTVIFNDLNIDCPNSNYGIYIHSNRGEINNVLVKNAINTCVSIYKGSTTGRYGNLNVNGLRCQLSEVGLDIHATDVFIEDFLGYNCMTHINVAAGLTHLKTVHGWNFNTQTKDWITGSTLIDAKGDINATDIYIDTLERGIALPTGKPYQLINIQNLSFFINTSSYPKSQNPPEIFYNVSAYTGKLHCDGVAANANAWTDINDKYPILIGDVPESRIKLTNVSRDGFRQDVTYKPDLESGDIQLADINITVTTYVAMHTRKYVARDHLLNIVMLGTMKVGCPNDTVIYQCEFLSDLLKRCNRRANVNAVFCETSNDGYVYKLGATVDDNGKLSVFNNSGVNLGGAGHYGSIAVYIEMDNNYT